MAKSALARRKNSPPVDLAPPIDLALDVFDQPAVKGPEAERALRELFWCNVVREMLTDLSMMGMRVARSRGPKGAKLQAEIFDGRVAVITRRGRRIGIAQVTPLFACGMTSNELEREVSIAVECTVFKIVTPEGEVWTLPLSEIRSVHSLSEDLIKRLQAEERSAGALGEGESEAPRPPFGFAAFTSLAQTVKQEVAPVKAAEPTKRVKVVKKKRGGTKKTRGASI